MNILNENDQLTFTASGSKVRKVITPYLGRWACFVWQAWRYYPGSGFAPKSVSKIGYLERPNLNPNSKISDPSKLNPDPDILIFKSKYLDPYFFKVLKF